MATTEISPVLPMKPNVFRICLKETKYELPANAGLDGWR